MISPLYTVGQQQVHLSGSRPVRVERRLLVTGIVGAHDHDYFEVMIVTHGTARHQTPGGERPLRRGSVAILAPRDIHAIDACEGLQVINVYYLAEWLLTAIPQDDRDHLRSLFLERALFGSTGGDHATGSPSLPPSAHATHGEPHRLVPRELDLTAESLESVERECEDIGAELERKEPSRAYLCSALVKVMTVLARGAVVAGEPVERHIRAESWAVLDAAEAAVRTGSALAPGNIASALSITPDHLARIFNADTGLPPRAYLVRRRAYEAAARLLDSTSRITEIAIELGYSDGAHLSRSFRDVFGMSPREYRRRYTG
jgi:AraC family L-rhamnose operon transcriptional activator RhaR